MIKHFKYDIFVDNEGKQVFLGYYESKEEAKQASLKHKSEKYNKFKE